MWAASASYSHFFSKNSVYAIFNDQSFNDTLTNDVVSFEQLGPGMQYNSQILHVDMYVAVYLTRLQGLKCNARHLIIR